MRYLLAMQYPMRQSPKDPLHARARPCGDLVEELLGGGRGLALLGGEEALLRVAVLEARLGQAHGHHAAHNGQAEHSGTHRCSELTLYMLGGSIPDRVAFKYT